MDEKRQEIEDNRNGRWRKNQRERRAIDAYQLGGWIVTTRGLPTFFSTKPGQRPRCVWVAKNHIDPNKAGLTQAQKRGISIFMSLGLPIHIVWPGDPNPCAPDGAKPIQKPEELKPPSAGKGKESKGGTIGG